MDFYVLRSTTLDDLSIEIQQYDQLHQLTLSRYILMAELCSKKCLPNFHKVISGSSLHIPMLLMEFHSSPTGGNKGFFRTWKRISQVLYWTGIKTDVKTLWLVVEFASRTSMKP